MIQTLLAKIFFALIIIALQVLIFNHVHIFGYATPLICVYILLTFPLKMPKWSKLMWGFCIGAIQDAFANTPGIMAATLTFMALLQSPLLKILGGQNDNDGDEMEVPSIKTLGTFSFLRYAAVAVFIQTLVFYLLMTFNFFDFVDTAINIVGSSVLSFLIIWFIEGIRSNSKK